MERVSGGSRHLANCEEIKRRAEYKGKTYGELRYVEAKSRRDAGYVLSFVFFPVFAGVSIGTGVGAYQEKQKQEEYINESGMPTIAPVFEDWERKRFISAFTGALAIGSLGAGIVLGVINNRKMRLYESLLRSDPSKWKKQKKIDYFAFSPVVMDGMGGAAVAARF